jgi:hypothetical protein
MTNRATLLRSIRTIAIVVLIAAAGTLWATRGHAQSVPGQGPGGPVLVVTDAGDPFGRYDAEILRAEGLNEFAVIDKANLNTATLASYQVVVLAHTTSLSAAQVTTLNDWVQGGGNLIAMRPDKQLAGLLGLADAGGTLANGYVKVDTGSGPGAGITGATMQFHGTADRYTLNGATSIAALYTNATAATANPAVTLRSVGTHGGQAAAFTYDLAQSVVYTRQGNPDWAGQERDGQTDVIRSDDMFFDFNSAQSWVDMTKVAIPQADEQQRLLANLIEQMNLDRAPLPRFWYLPRGLKAAVVVSGDDHATGGTADRFNAEETASPDGCSVPDWECVRSTSYVYPGTPNLSDDQVKAFQDDGFEIGLHLHVTTGTSDCNDIESAQTLDDDFTNQLQEFAQSWPSAAAPVTSRTHCIVWKDWTTEPSVEVKKGIRLDANYYYWPGAWVKDRPGFFTGSGFPMRFAAADGAPIDVYQAATQLTDESGQTISKEIKALLDKALGAEGYYGVITANMHTDKDKADSAEYEQLVAEATSRGVPLISAKQLLTWIDGREGSAFQSVGYAANKLTFTVSPGSGARGLQAMVPTHTTKGALTLLTRAGAAVPTTIRTVKGIEYAFFDAVGGSYTATYDGPLDPPADTNTPPDTTVPGGQASSSNQASSKSATTTSDASGNATTSRKAPRVTISKRTVRASRDGTVTVRVSCPRSAVHCQVNLVLRRAGRQLGHKLVTVGGGKTAKVKLHLTRAARKQLARAGSLKVDVVATTAGSARNHSTTTTRIRVLAPGTR